MTRVLNANVLRLCVRGSVSDCTCPLCLKMSLEPRRGMTIGLKIIE